LLKFFPAMPVITLTSDWNLHDFYLGALKGKIISLLPDVTLVDISHQIPNFNTAHAAFILKNSYHHYPKGSVHLIAINAVSNPEKSHVAVKAGEHYFVGCDNGIFELIFNTVPEAIIQIKSGNNDSIFPSLSVFAEAACHLAAGKKISDLGKPIDQLSRSVPLRAAIDDSVITGSVIYIDSYENAITNITHDLFERVGKGRPFEIHVTSNHYMINKLNRKYGETTTGEILALFNSLDLLEIAINNGNAARLLNLDPGSSVRIAFKDKNTTKSSKKTRK
jgi:S-adenosylmethionine hydrolase